MASRSRLVWSAHWITRPIVISFHRETPPPDNSIGCKIVVYIHLCQPYPCGQDRRLWLSRLRSFIISQQHSSSWKIHRTGSNADGSWPRRLGEFGYSRSFFCKLTGSFQVLYESVHIASARKVPGAVSIVEGWAVFNQRVILVCRSCPSTGEMMTCLLFVVEKCGGVVQLTF